MNKIYNMRHMVVSAPHPKTQLRLWTELPDGAAKANGPLGVELISSSHRLSGAEGASVEWH